MKKSAEERFWSKVNKIKNNCWIWIGAKDSSGYGSFWNKKVVSAHRQSYEFLKGKIPKGLEIIHTCHIRHCVNPSHMILDTHAKNIKYDVSKDRYYTRKKSENTNTAILNYDKAEEIRADYNNYQNSKYSFCKIKAKQYKVYWSTIWKLLENKTWQFG